MPRGRSRGPAQDRSLGAARRLRPAVARRRCHASRRTRSVHAATRPSPARARSAPPTRPSRPNAERHRGRRPATSPGLPRARALTGATPRASTPWLAPGTPPLQRNLLVPAPVLRNARGRLQPLHRVSPPPARGAMRGGPGRFPDRLRPPVRGEPCVARSARPLRTRPTARADDGTSPHRPASTSLPAQLPARPSPGSRAASPRATEALGRPAALPPPGVATAVRRVGAAPAAA